MKKGISGAVNSSTDRGKRIEREDDEKNAQGNQRADDQLRKVLAEIGIQCLDALDRRCGKVAGAFSPCVGRPQRQDVGEQSFPKICLDLYGGAVRRYFVDPYQEPPASHDD